LNVETSARLLLAATALTAIALPPLAGAWLAGASPVHYLALPPLPPPPQETEFRWSAFAAFAIAEVAVLAPFVLRLWQFRRAAVATRPAKPFPFWGWLALAALLLCWGLAWADVPQLAPLRRHAFTPLWFSYVVVINAWTLRRAGTCLLTAAPGRFIGLFAASAAFWWSFEYLDQFAANWHYVNATAGGPWERFVAGTLPFSTVLPAVIGTRDLLATFPAFHRALDGWWRPPQPSRRPAGWATLGASVILLGLLGAYGKWLYPLVWLAPLGVITGLQAVAGDRHVLTPLGRGDWGPLWLAAMAGLACGFLWELWNWLSLARWSYSVPLVDGVHLFAMPLVGYGGYLPFGLICVAAARLLSGLDVRPFTYTLDMDQATRRRRDYRVTPAPDSE
jgi:hypothetical protein